MIKFLWRNLQYLYPIAHDKHAPARYTERVYYWWRPLEWFNQSTNQSINQQSMNNQSINQPTNQSNNQSGYHKRTVIQPLGIISNRHNDCKCLLILVFTDTLAIEKSQYVCTITQLCLSRMLVLFTSMWLILFSKSVFWHWGNGLWKASPRPFYQD